LERSEVISKLKSDGAVYRCQGLLACLTCDIRDEEIVKEIRKLTADHTVILGRPLSALANATLDRLGIEPYTGTDQATLEFIKNL